MVVVGEEDCLFVHDAKPNISICQCSFGKVATRTSYINQLLYAPKEVLGLVVILLFFSYIISMEAVVQSLSMHFFYYYNNNSCNTDVTLSSVQHHSALSVQLSGTQC